MKRTALASLHEAAGARWRERFGWEIPAAYSTQEEEYRALCQGAALLDLSDRGKLRITGRDRRTWLHGQVTQEIKELPDGRGAYATILTPQGHMVGDLNVFALPDALLADYPAGTQTPLSEYLDRYLIMERAEIEDLTEEWALLAVQGPRAPEVVAALFGEGAAGMHAWAVQEAAFAGEPVYLARISVSGEDGYQLFVPTAQAPALWTALLQALPGAEVRPVGWEALNVRRVEAGIPWWGEEMDARIVPLEARLNHAISINKGCYVGQEIIARIHARGHVNNLLAGFFVHGDVLPARDTEIHHNGKRVGRVGTVVHSPSLGRPIALGYLRREWQTPGQRVQAMEPAGPVELEVAALPFVVSGE